MTPATTTTKKELIDRIADETNQKRSVVQKTVQAFLDNVIHELGQGRRLEFRDFGVFETRTRAARFAQNPKTLERVFVPPRVIVKFKEGRLMKDALEQNLGHNGEEADGRGAASPNGHREGELVGSGDHPAGNGRK